MLDVQEIRRVLSTISQVDKGAVFSPLVRSVLVALVGWCVVKGKVYGEFLAAYIGLVLLGASLMAIGFTENVYHPIFFILFPLGLLWGREALMLPPRPRFSYVFVGAAAAFGLVAFFYPYFTKGIFGALLFAPVGVLPASSLLLAQAAIIATKRSYSLYTVVPTWVVSTVFALIGIFLVNVSSPVNAGLEWVLLASTAASIASYLFAPKEEPRRKLRKLKRH